MSLPNYLNPVKDSYDFDGDGRTDFFFINRISGALQIELFSGSSSSNLPNIPQSSGWLDRSPLVADFNGDGEMDIFWQNSLTGQRALWIMDGEQIVEDVALPTIPKEWVGKIGDFNGDRKADIFWTNPTLVGTGIWIMDGTTLVQAQELPGVSFPAINGSGLAQPYIGDFNGDNRSDILWRTEDNGGGNVIWLMDNVQIVAVSNSFDASLPQVAAQWQPSIADFNGDGRSDIFWTNRLTDERAIWTMSGLGYDQAAFLPPVPLDWQYDVGDFNGDGKADFFWQNQVTGERAFWLMDGINLLEAQASVRRPASLRFDVVELDGDVRSELLAIGRVDGQIVSEVWDVFGSRVVRLGDNRISN
jgi:FG-GAP-like repeat